MQDVAPRQVSLWLKDVCQANAVSASRLHNAFIRQGGESSERTTARWISGTTEPTAGDLIFILRALEDLIGSKVVQDFVTRVVREDGDKGKGKGALARKVTGKTAKSPRARRTASRR